MISVNVYGYEKSELYILHYTKNKLDKHVNLLYLKNDEYNHYCWIKNINRLLRTQMSEHQLFWCHRCLLNLY
ncbi:hypothetical protein X975_10487, partial [Stegodyphus mimosarum]